MPSDWNHQWFCKRESNSELLLHHSKHVRSIEHFENFVASTSSTFHRFSSWKHQFVAPFPEPMNSTLGEWKYTHYRVSEAHVHGKEGRGKGHWPLRLQHGKDLVPPGSANSQRNSFSLAEKNYLYSPERRSIQHMVNLMRTLNRGLHQHRSMHLDHKSHSFWLTHYHPHILRGIFANLFWKNWFSLFSLWFLSWYFL